MEKQKAIMVFSDKNSIDGMGCIVLAKLAFGSISYTLFDNSKELSKSFSEMLDRQSLKDYDQVYITDLKLSNSVIEKLLSDESHIEKNDTKIVVHPSYLKNKAPIVHTPLSEKVLVFAHDKSIIDRDYSFNMIVDDFEQKCSTDLFYDYLVSNGLLTKTYALDKFVESVRRSHLYGSTNEVSMLFEACDNKDYRSRMQKKLDSEGTTFDFTDEEKEIIEKAKASIPETEEVPKRKIEFSEYKQMAEQNQINGTILKNIQFDFNHSSGSIIYNETFEDAEFNNVKFVYMGIKECIFRRCKFINCNFHDFCFSKCEFYDCYFEGAYFVNNTDVTHNKFVRVSGSVEDYAANGFSDNTFIDMDFSGFLPFYSYGNHNKKGMIKLNRNYFINTTISLEALREFSKDKEVIASMPYSSKVDYRSIINESCTFFLVDEWFGEPMSVGLDISGMTEDEKLNIVAGVFTKYHTNHSLIVQSSEGLGEESRIHYQTVPNPRPAKIVDSRGYELNPDVIQDIDFEEQLTENAYRCHIHDCSKTYKAKPENRLDNPDNYSCYGLARTYKLTK